MSILLAAALAGAAVTLLGGLSGDAALRLRALARVPVTGPPGRPPGRQVVLGLGLAAPVGALLLLGPAACALVAIATLGLVRMRRRQAAAKDREAERRRAVEACAALAAELRAGRPPALALAVAADLARGPSRQALRAAAATAGWGGDVPAAIVAATDRASAVPEVLRGLAACWQVCARTGSGLAAAVERLADGLRARQAQERAVATALAGPRASATLLAGLPLAGIGLAAGLGAHPLHVLLRTALGLGCLTGGLALDGLGLWWTGRIVARAAG